MSFEFLTFPTPTELRPYLKHSFFAKGRIPYRSDKILSNGMVAVIFNCGKPHRVGKSAVPEENASYAHSWLHGVQVTPLYNTPGGGTHVLGLLFEPIGFHALFGVDMRSLHERTRDARDVLAHEFVAEVESLLSHAADAAAHAKLHLSISNWPKRALPSWLWRLHEAIVESEGGLSLRDTYKDCGRSSRHINASFKRATGVTPKVLCRIYRLQALLKDIDPAHPVTWTELAHAHGFYDHAHFNREFRAFSGLHPRQYLEQRRRDLPGLGKGESVHFAPQR